MNHLIIYSHINSKSFSHAILNKIVKVSEKKGANIKIRDLNSLKFNPILSASDMEAFGKGETPSDIKEEQDYIKWANTITFIYPLWWGHMPAILKGYIDRVFSLNFAYAHGENGVEGLLIDKKMMVFTPMGNSIKMYEEEGILDALRTTTDTCIFEFCGIKQIEHMHLGEVPLVSEEIRKQMLDDIANLVNNML